MFTGQYSTGAYEDCITISGYRTGGTLLCPETGDQDTGTIDQDT